MKFVVDECTGPGVAKWLEGQGYDVLSIFEIAQGSTDVQVLRVAVEQDRILFKIAALEQLFASYASSLEGRFVVVAGDKIRIAG